MSQVGLNLRKFEKKSGNLVKIWPKIGRLVYECVTFSCKVGICMGPISNSQRHVPTKTKLELPQVWYRGGGALNFFSGRGVRPGFPKCGAYELTFASEKGGLWAENFQIWGLVSWKFPSLGACELKFGWKLRLLRLKFPNFLKGGSCELTLLLEIGPLRAAGEAWKGGLQGRTSPYPLSRSVPPGVWYIMSYHE